MKASVFDARLSFTLNFQNSKVPSTNKHTLAPQGFETPEMFRDALFRDAGINKIGQVKKNY